MNLIKSRIVSQIGSKTVISKTAYTNDGANSGRSDAPIGGFVTRRYACGNFDGGGDAGTVDVDVYLDADIAIAYSRSISGQDYM